MNTKVCKNKCFFFFFLAKVFSFLTRCKNKYSINEPDANL